jgi:hypothetical protein
MASDELKCWLSICPGLIGEATTLTSGDGGHLLLPGRSAEPCTEWIPHNWLNLVRSQRQRIVITDVIWHGDPASPLVIVAAVKPAVPA